MYEMTTPRSEGLSDEEASELLKVWGRNEIIETVKPTWLGIWRQASTWNFKVLRPLYPIGFLVFRFLIGGSFCR